MALSTIDTSSIGGLGYGFKNRIINGGCQIAQRGTTAVTFDTAGTYIIDRWTQNNSGGATITGQQSSTAPTGFSNSLYVNTSSGAAPSAAQLRTFSQYIEGLNVVDLAWGTASAQPVTVSFWVRSSTTGTFCCFVANAAFNRSQIQTFTISAANTWEYKTATFTGDTSGTWLTTNGIGVIFGIDVGSGTNYNATANTWNAGYYTRTSGAVTLSTTTSNNIYITGVQLEKGTVATSFDWRPYGTELALCQRYYYRITAPVSASILGPAYAQSATGGRISGTFPVTMRISPSALEQNGTAGDYVISVGAGDKPFTSVPAFNSLTNQYMWFVTTTVSGGQTAAQAGVGYIGTSGAYLGWSAEL